MKIAIDCRLFGNSGIGTFIKNIVDYIVINRDVSFLLIGKKKEISYYKKYSNVSIIENDIKPFSLKELFNFPTKEINECDAFFTPYINIPLSIKVPIFSTIHDVIFFDLKELTSFSGRWLRWLFYKSTCKRSKLIFTVSNFSKQRIIHHFNPSIPIKIIYNGVATKIKEASNENNSKKNYILYVGNIKPHKGLRILINAYNIAKERGLNQNLLIVGEYKNFKTTDNEIFEALNSNKDNIFFTGRLSDEELIQTIKEAQVLVLPSYYEGFGIPPLEALYLGTDAIISDIPTLREIYKDLPVNFFKAGDAENLSKLLSSYKHIKTDEFRLVRNVINEKYNFKITANQILETIKANL